MSTSTVAVPRSPGRSLALPRAELPALLVVAAALYLWSLDANGFANEYYSAAVRSMSESWHAFLFGSFDAAGVMTVDKPPLALWVQALSVRAFGLSSWSMLIPQALMGVASVALVYDLTRRRFGRAAGFGAGLVLALTPVSVAIFRHNNPDALLILCLTAALWFVVRGLEDGRARWLVLSGVCVGLGFEAKMGAALIVVPAIATAWVWVAPRGRLAALRQLGLGAAAMAIVGFAWPVLVWLTPASERPWISGTADNSIWSLIFGYNGLGRVTGQQGAPGGGGPGGGGGAFGGEPGPLRLLNESLGGQAGWLLGFAIVAAMGVVAVSRLRRDDPRTGWIVAVGGAFVTTAVAFSLASGIFHPYYVSQLAPLLAALVGAGIGVIATDVQAGRIVGPLAIVAAIFTELLVLGQHPGQLEWLPAVFISLCGIAACALALGPNIPRTWRSAALVGAMAVLLIAPASWAVQTLGHPTSGTFPAGGPSTTGFGGGPGADGGARFGGSPGGGPPRGGFARPGGDALDSLFGNAGPAASGRDRGSFGGFGGGTESLSDALAYVERHGGGTLAVSSQSGAAGQVISSGANLAALGGFSGRETEVSLDWLADAVDQGRVRWVLAGGASGGMFDDGRTGSTQLMAAVQEVGTEIGAVGGLYDLRGHAGELRRLAS